MRKIKIIITLMLTGKLLFAQCDYFEDSTALRVNGTVSAPTCSGNFTHCSKNGSSISPYGNYRVLNFIFRTMKKKFTYYSSLAQWRFFQKKYYTFELRRV
jgi:hypothetical protein